MTQKPYAQKRQQELFQILGTLSRNKINLENLARSRINGIIVSVTPLQQRILDAAANVLIDLSKQASAELQNLPSKKNLKGKDKDASA